ncbi:nucleotidyltransferase family protein [Acetobacterium fimetarium]|uniref:tRNA(Met) cytidine acetate ligase n=1 Tax=Acetobacterium fimetarium TaxID=52691 RepID=UPI00164B7539|nr:nucleotidyltransferase family protein [Acetobacterium fimetarium]
MKILGVIAEYNPFHKGHAWQIGASKKASGCDAVMVLMSGSMTQRGDFALLNKWERARLALSAGVDLVCELPVAYAGQSAEAFAGGGVKILNATAVCDVLSFGSESGELEPLNQLAQLLAEESPEFKLLLKKKLATGVSFPTARMMAVNQLSDDASGTLLHAPNNILAVEYLKALHRTQSPIVPMTVKRQGAGYHSLSACDYLSASKIRSILIDALQRPEAAAAILKQLDRQLPYPLDDVFLPVKQTHRVGGDERLLDALRLLILSRDVDHLKNTPYVAEGLEHKIRDAVKTADTLAELIDAIVSKRIPHTRVRRILGNRVLELNKQTLATFQSDDFTPYLRVLGFNQNGREILKRIKDHSELPILTNLKTNENRLNDRQRELLYYDCRATDLHNLFYENGYNYHRDYTQSPIRLDL